MSEPSKIFVHLTPEEIEQKGRELAAAVVALDELTEEKRELNKDLKDRRDRKEREARELSAAIRNKGEWRWDERQGALFGLPARKAMPEAEAHE